MKISIKLFLTLVGLTLVILATTLFLTRWTFDQGFQDFYLAIETQRLKTSATSLSELYQNAGNNWQAISPHQIEIILRGKRNGPAGGPPPGRSDRQHRPPQLSDDPINTLPGQPRPPPTTLYDEKGNLLAGRAHQTSEHQITVPVVVNQKVIGELRSQPQPLVNWELANAFSRHQTRTSLGIAVLGIFLSAIMSLFLTRHLVKPIMALRNKLSLLTQGTYDSEFELSRKDELGELMRDIATLSSTLDHTRSANKRWIADISHELRTPLTILTGEIDALQAGYRPLNNTALISIGQEVDRLSHLVNDLYQLSLADIGGLKYTFTRKCVVSNVQHAIDACQHEAEDKGLQIFFSPPASVYANIDERRTEQLFLNILKNAVAYTDSPGEIHIHIKNDTHFVIVEIEDTAPGVAASNCEQIFQPLFREDQSRVRRGSGAGLGLSICKNIAEAHQGEIFAEPSSKGGLKVTIKLSI